MSERIGLAHCAQRQNAFLPGADGAVQRDCSEETARQIDQEVKKILDRCYAEAKDILSEHLDQLELVTRQLLERETLDRASFYKLIGRAEPKEPVKATPELEPQPVQS
jgi:cell division protease FtsH